MCVRFFFFSRENVVFALSSRRFFTLFAMNRFVYFNLHCKKKEPHKEPHKKTATKQKTNKKNWTQRVSNPTTRDKLFKSQIIESDLRASHCCEYRIKVPTRWADSYSWIIGARIILVCKPLLSKLIVKNRRQRMKTHYRRSNIHHSSIIFENKTKNRNAKQTTSHTTARYCSLWWEVSSNKNNELCDLLCRCVVALRKNKKFETEQKNTKIEKKKRKKKPKKEKQLWLLLLLFDDDANGGMLLFLHHR